MPLELTPQVRSRPALSWVKVMLGGVNVPYVLLDVLIDDDRRFRKQWKK